MCKFSRHAPVALALMLGFLSTSCLIKGRRTIKRGGIAASQAKPLLTASRDDLNNRIAASYNAIQSFQATVELSASVGSVYKDKITDYQDVRAYVLFRKLSDMRLIGKLPVVGTTAFDMVSTGGAFRLSLPTKNRFITGENGAPATSKNPIENLRPYALLSSMMIKPLDAETELMFLEDDTDEKDAFYVLHFVKKGANGSLLVLRAVWFDRVTLAIVRQREYDDDALITSDTHYKNWTNYNGISFPANIDITRPKDGYGVTMAVEAMKINLPLADASFILNQPPDAQLQVLGAAAVKENIK